MYNVCYDWISRNKLPSTYFEKQRFKKIGQTLFINSLRNKNFLLKLSQK